MTPEDHARVGALLDGFFGNGNEIKRSHLQRSQRPAASCARQWVDFIQASGGPVILPRKQGQGLTWYAISRSHGQARDLAEQISAFAGPSFSTFRGEAVTLDPGDPVDAAVLDFSSAPVYRCRSEASPEANDRLAHALELLLKVRRTTAARSTEETHATGRVLRDFNMALAASDRIAAQAALDYLRNHRRLDPVNLDFLQVQLHAVLGQWEALLEMPDLPDLKQVRRPVAVTQAMIQAEYRLRLARWEFDPAQAVQVLQDEVLPGSGTLFTSCRGMSEPDALKAFMLLAVAQPSQELADVIRNVPGLSAVDLAFLDSLASLLPSPKPPPPADPILLSQEALDVDDFERAYHFAGPAQPSVQRTKILLRCSAEIPTNDVAKLASEAVEAHSPTEQDQVLRTQLFRNLWTRIRATPGGWQEWLDRIADPPWTSSRALQIAEQGASEWPIDDLLRGSQADFLAERVEALVDNPLLHDALPFLIRYFERDDGFPRPGLQRLYTSLRVVLAYNCTNSLPELELYNGLCEASLKLRLPAVGYREMIEEAISLCRQAESGASLNGFLDLMGYLLYYPTPTPADRLRFGETLFSTAMVLAHRADLTAEQWRELFRLATMTGQSDLIDVSLAPEDDTSPGTSSGGSADPLSVMDGMVAIYTLTESAGQQARDAIQARSPGCRVELCHDKVATPRLQALARAADMFVMVIQSAKHAATECITSHRGNRPLVIPRGRGASSILAALADRASMHELGTP